MPVEVKRNKLRALLSLLLIFGPAILLIFIGTRGCDHKFEKLADYGSATKYSFIDVNGKTRTYSEFDNSIILISSIQESCPDTCSISLWHVDQILYQHIRKNKSKKLKQVKLISFVTDGKGNPVKDLKYMSSILKERVEGYDPELWILATGDVKSIYNFTNNGKSLLEKGKQYFGGEYFQEILLLIDKSNHLRMALRGNQEGMVRTMKEHLALLQKQYDKEAKQN
ncbi:MAG: SCO family protein [Bacteroidota bacterium]|jgi:cytochrome oxidase Cu insertion factor (SCO1/SenC/PrrC family)